MQYALHRVSAQFALEFSMPLNASRASQRQFAHSVSTVSFCMNVVSSVSLMQLVNGGCASVLASLVYDVRLQLATISMHIAIDLLLGCALVALII